jgi:CHAT domain-containing protein
LFLVPFAALQDATDKYLIEKDTILTAPSIQVLDLTRQQQVSTKEAPVVGNPTMPSISLVIGEPPQPLPSLPGAERQAMAIAQILPPKRLQAILLPKPPSCQKYFKGRQTPLNQHGCQEHYVSP